MRETIYTPMIYTICFITSTTRTMKQTFGDLPCLNNQQNTSLTKK